MGRSSRRKKERRNEIWREPTAEGFVVHLGGPAGAETIAALEKQRTAFREKFGREPAADDPVFFDPDAVGPDPVALTSANVEAETVEAMHAAGIDPAFIYAYQLTGMLVTEENATTWSEADLREFDEAIDRFNRQQGNAPT